MIYINYLFPSPIHKPPWWMMAHPHPAFRQEQRQQSIFVWNGIRQGICWLSRRTIRPVAVSSASSRKRSVWLRQKKRVAPFVVFIFFLEKNLIFLIGKLMWTKKNLILKMENIYFNYLHNWHYALSFCFERINIWKSCRTCKIFCFFLIYRKFRFFFLIFRAANPSFPPKCARNARRFAFVGIPRNRCSSLAGNLVNWVWWIQWSERVQKKTMEIAGK